MKYLFVFCLSFLFIGSISAQCYIHEYNYGTQEWEVVPIPCDVDDDDGSGAVTGDTNNPTNITPCQTNMTRLPDVTVPCGNSGFITTTSWAVTCTSGNVGTCTTGIFVESVEIDGCEDIDLDPPAQSNLTTVECN